MQTEKNDSSATYINRNATGGEDAATTTSATPLITNKGDPNTPNTISHSLKIQDLLNSGLSSSGAVGGTATTSASTTAAAAAPLTSQAAASTATKTTTTTTTTSTAAVPLSARLGMAAGATATAAPSSAMSDRMRAELVRKNWKTVLDVALKKKNELIENEMSINLNSSMNNRAYDENREIYATDKENWIFFSIIISIVIVFSVLFCFVVYYFFPQFRSKSN